MCTERWIRFLKVIEILVKIHWEEWSISRKLAGNHAKYSCFMSEPCRNCISWLCFQCTSHKFTSCCSFWTTKATNDTKPLVNCILFINLELKGTAQVKINWFPFLLSATMYQNKYCKNHRPVSIDVSTQQCWTNHCAHLMSDLWHFHTDEKHHGAHFKTVPYQVKWLAFIRRRAISMEILIINHYYCYYYYYY